MDLLAPRVRGSFTVGTGKVARPGWARAIPRPLNQGDSEGGRAMDAGQLWNGAGTVDVPRPTPSRTAQARPGPDVERAVRGLGAALCSGRRLSPECQELAERLGFPLREDYAAFVAVLHGGQALRHAALAKRLRDAGALALSEGQRVVGLRVSRIAFEQYADGEELVVAESGPTPRVELPSVLAELRAQADIARRAGVYGRVGANDFLLELLIHGSERVSSRIEEMVFGPLQNEQLAATVETLAICDFDRQRTAAALPVHRNTLSYRLRRISELTGLDFSSGRDRTIIWLAVAQQRAKPAAPGGGPPALPLNGHRAAG